MLQFLSQYVRRILRDLSNLIVLTILVFLILFSTIKISYFPFATNYVVWKLQNHVIV